MPEGHTEATCRTSELAPDNLEARIALVKFYLLQRKLDEAANDIEFILQKEPQNIEALCCSRDCVSSKKNRMKLVVIFRKIIVLDSRNETGLPRSGPVTDAPGGKPMKPNRF